MKTPILWLSLCLGAACSSTALVVDAASRQRLFRVTKSENANYVAYDLLLDEDGRIAAQPVEAYWIMAENGGERVGLSSMELGLYDVAVEKCDREAGCLAFKINGVDSKLMTVTVPADGEPAEVSTTIDGTGKRVSSRLALMAAVSMTSLLTLCGPRRSSTNSFDRST